MKSRTSPVCRIARQGRYSQTRYFDGSMLINWARRSAGREGYERGAILKEPRASDWHSSAITRATAAGRVPRLDKFESLRRDDLAANPPPAFIAEVFEREASDVYAPDIDRPPATHPDEEARVLYVRVSQEDPLGFRRSGC